VIRGDIYHPDSRLYTTPGIRIREINHRVGRYLEHQRLLTRHIENSCLDLESA